MGGRLEPWRECADWLTRCGVLRGDHIAICAQAKVGDLALTLRDGVVLCNLLNVIEPGCIDTKDVNQKPRLAQFLCLRNIKIFLQACKDVFGLKESDLFDPLGLYDLTDFLRVLHTLSKLSLSPIFQKKNISGFTLGKSRSSSQDDIYRALPSSLTPDDQVKFAIRCHTNREDVKMNEIPPSQLILIPMEGIHCILERFQSKILRVPVNVPWNVPNSSIRADLNIRTVELDRNRSLSQQVFCQTREPFESHSCCPTEGALRPAPPQQAQTPRRFRHTLTTTVISATISSGSWFGRATSHSIALPGDDEEYSSHHVHMHNEEIYQDLCSISRISCNQISSSLPASLEKRDYVINELVETERNYLDVLGSLQRSFMRPLASVIREEDFKIIFAYIKDLYEIHSAFLTQLRKATAPHSRSKLSAVFLSYREKFLIYGEYIANLTNAQNLIQDLCVRSDVINNEVEKCQRENNNGKFKLRDILSVPMQRILKYHLLLDKLVSETQMNHEDYRGLERAKEGMIDVAQYINEVKRDSDTLAILADIEQSITDWHMPPEVTLKDYGRLILDGELRIKAHNDQKQKVRYVFVFDTVMVMCKAIKGDQYCYKESLRLDEYKIQDNERKILTRDARWSYQWYLVHRAKRTAYTCYSRTEEFKKKWMNAISEALDNIEPSGCRNTEHVFKMHTFDKPTTCSYCTKFLKGKIYQGYQCEKCQLSCHKMCIPLCGRCGVNKLPVLPPRLASTNLNRPSTPVRTAPSPVNYDSSLYEKLKSCLWFVGEMGRERASNLLENELDGTYLLRIRPKGPTNPSETVFALSLKTNERVKHMKVYEEHVEDMPSYYLSVSRYFKSIIELVTYYQHVSLEENFVGLDVKLQYPYRRIIAVAEFDFMPTEPNHLPLRTGCRVIVLSKEGDNRGWWKGKIQNREGFFPKQYVREISDTMNLFADSVQ